MDNVPELISQKMAARAVELAFIQPDEPAQSAYIECFNRTFRETVLYAHLVASLREAREIAEEWIEEYNATCAHEALQNQSPYQYASECA